MGMTPEQYWDGESELKKFYRQAYKIRMENEERVADRNAWLQGIYIREALVSVPLFVNGFIPKGSKPQEYPKKPRLEEVAEARTREEKKKKEENQMQLQMALFQAMAERFNKNFRKRQEQEKEKEQARAVVT